MPKIKRSPAASVKAIKGIYKTTKKQPKQFKKKKAKVSKELKSQTKIRKDGKRVSRYKKANGSWGPWVVVPLGAAGAVALQHHRNKKNEYVPDKNKISRKRLAEIYAEIDKLPKGKTIRFSEKRKLKLHPEVKKREAYLKKLRKIRYGPKR